MIITIDTGGTKTLIAEFSDDGEIKKEIKFKTPKDINEYLAQIEQKTIELLNEKPASENIDVVSVAIPGIIDGGKIIWANNLGWKNINIKEEVANIFDNVPIFIDNDANLAALAEAKLLPQSYNNIMYLTLSTGIGSGFVTNGQINHGLSKSEPGRIKTPYKGQLVQWEDFASGRAITEEFGRYASEIDSPAIWNDIAERISLGLNFIIPIVQPDIIIFGGSMGAQFDKFAPFLGQSLNNTLPSYIAVPKLKIAQNPNKCVIYGCYHHAKEQISSSTK